MLAVKVAKKGAEKAKRFLREKNLLAEGVSATRDNDFVYFPVVKKVAGFVCVRKRFKAGERALSLRDALKEKLSAKEMRLLRVSHDTIGSIAILEIPFQLEKKEKLVAHALLSSNKRVRTVLKKAGAFKGDFRVRKLEWLAGAKRFSSLYKESGCVMKVDLRKAYFSPRLSHERLRIASQVKEGEKVLALFAGVGPYALVIAKKQPSARVVAVELNPDAAKLLRQNVLLNKLDNVEVLEGDVRDVLPRFKGWANRIAMPLPHTGQDFLDCVLPAAKRGCVVHFYGFGHREDLYSKALAAIKKECRAAGRTFRVTRKAIVRPYAPKVFQVVIDFVVG